MPTYVYRCPDGHQQEEIHSMKVDPAIACKKCGAPMRRVPQAPLTINFYGGKNGLLLSWMDRNYELYRAEKAGRNPRRERLSPDMPVRPDPVPGTQASFRRAKKKE